MKLTVKIQDGQLSASAEADFEQSIINIPSVHGYGSVLGSIAMDSLFNAMGVPGDGPDDGDYPDEPESRLPAMPPQPQN